MQPSLCCPSLGISSLRSLLIMTAVVNIAFSRLFFRCVLFSFFFLFVFFAFSGYLINFCWLAHFSIFLSRNLHEFSACCKVKKYKQFAFFAVRLNKSDKKCRQQQAEAGSELCQCKCVNALVLANSRRRRHRRQFKPAWCEQCSGKVCGSQPE